MTTDNKIHIGATAVIVSIMLITIGIMLYISFLERKDMLELYKQGQENLIASYSKEQKDLFDKKIQAIRRLNIHNKVILNSAKMIINEKDYERIAFVDFLIEPYYQNAEVFASLSQECQLNYLIFLGNMEAVNSSNHSIVDLYNQEVLISTTTQALISQRKKNFWYEFLEKNIKEVELSFDKIINCFP